MDRRKFLITSANFLLTLVCGRFLTPNAIKVATPPIKTPKSEDGGLQFPIEFPIEFDDDLQEVYLPLVRRD